MFQIETATEAWQCRAMIAQMAPMHEGVLKIPSDPLQGFEVWFNEAVAFGCPEPTAMTLATCSKEGRPSARIVLHKGLKRGGFFFVTNYESRKGHEIEANPFAALVFHWVTMRRQIRIEGHLEKATQAESEAYFHSRRRESQLGAWSSPQSAPIAGRTELTELVEANEKKFDGVDPLPMPPFWGGYILTPARIEFWEERANRIHERIAFSRKDNGWVTNQLAP